MAPNTVALAPIERAVQRMYEAFPYPHYPLFGKPRWQDGYLASSKFAGRLFEDIVGREAAVNGPTGPFLRHARTVLVVGSGETLPYVMRRMEPTQHRLLCVDLSRRSLRRARFRLGFFHRRTDLVHSDINQYLRQQASVTGPFNHIDAFGVLHHLNNPSETLRLLATHLSSNGIMRLMVYNTPARRWIHEIQAAFRLMKLDPYLRSDRDFARLLLEELRTHSPTLRYKLDCLGKDTVRHDARLVDTFFHAREARLPIGRWFDIVEAARLSPFGLVDRYGELDDLPNPLWQTPTRDQIVERARDLRFENNLELYLRKQHLHETPARRYIADANGSRASLLRPMMRPPPHLWFSFPETQHISQLMRRKLWVAYLKHVAKVPSLPCDSLIKKLPEPAIARLCRLGAILPGQLKDEGLRQIGRAPMETSSEPPVRRDMANFEALPIKAMLEERLDKVDHRRTQRLALTLEHFKRAQVNDLESYRQFG